MAISIPTPRNWWILALRGLLAILFGVVAIVWPAATVAALVLLFGAYALVDGGFAVVAALRAAGQQRRWWPLVLEGAVGIAAGILTFLWPGITALVLLIVIAAWAILTGVLEIVAAVALRDLIQSEWLLGAAGVLSILFGVFVLMSPAIGAIAIVTLIAVYALVFGVLLLALAFRLKDLQERDDDQARRLSQAP